MQPRNIQNQGPQGGNGFFLGGNDSPGFVHLGGEMLKHVDTPVEAMLGAVNGALSGAVIASGVSALVSIAGHGSQHGAGGKILENMITKKHLLPMLVGTTALATIGGIVRYSRAKNHNEWAERTFETVLDHQPQQSFAQKEETRRLEPAEQAVQR
jgi:hypothetical protein